MSVLNGGRWDGQQWSAKDQPLALQINGMMEDSQWDTVSRDDQNAVTQRMQKYLVKSSALDLQILRSDRSPGAILTVLLGQELMRTNRGFPLCISSIVNVSEHAVHDHRTKIIQRTTD
jgi:hypothetical protein